ncbi:MAG TPA: DUF6599 family protein [Polyangiaceae bacterium]|nr:DUF6599 family protein [Polyangiaceae bacterium]
MRTRAPVVLSLLLSLLPGCKRDRDADDLGAAPPPPAPSAKPGLCAEGGGTPGDPTSAAFFPRVVGDYCVDPHGETRAYGEGAKGTLDDVCIQQLDGECEVYKSYGLRRVVTLRYADGKGSPGAVAVTLSRFAAKEGAYGFFTKRVVADGDPADVTLKEIPGGTSAALGSGIAYVYRGEYLAELSYTNETESPDQMRASGKQILPGIAQGIGDKLPGDISLPPSVLDLPKDHRLPMGTSYLMSDVLGIASLGGAALGYYKDGDRRYRVLVLSRSDDASATDVLETLKKVDHASTLKEQPFPALAFENQHDDAAPRTEWIAGRAGKKVFLVGDDELSLTGKSRDEEKKLKLSKDDKIALVRGLVTGH